AGSRESPPRSSATSMRPALRARRRLRWRIRGAGAGAKPPGQAEGARAPGMTVDRDMAHVADFVRPLRVPFPQAAVELDDLHAALGKGLGEPLLMEQEAQREAGNALVVGGLEDGQHAVPLQT